MSKAQSLCVDGEEHPVSLTPNGRFVVADGQAIRQRRLDLGWTQERLGKVAGYSERLIRKAEQGGSLDIETLQNLAEALSTEDHAVSAQSLVMSIETIARKWVESFARLGERMLPEVSPYLADDFVFVCPGDPSTAPFIGEWRGAGGYQQWLDLFHDFFQHNRVECVEYTSGSNTVIARWLQINTHRGVPCAPVRINMHFLFSNGVITRIDDDYDTQAGANNVAHAKAVLSGQS